MYRWFEQEEGSACMRCPQVVTNGKDLEAALNGAGYSDHSSFNETARCGGLQDSGQLGLDEFVGI